MPLVNDDEDIIIEELFIKKYPEINDIEEVEKENNETESSDENQKQPERQKTFSSRSYATSLRRNTLSLISNSTICVFQWNKSWYRCFICKDSFADVDELRQHSEKHTLRDIEEKIISQQNRMVKVEISELFCKLCQQQLENLLDLRQHLTSTHNYRFDFDEDLLMPFKINQDLQCQICGEAFETFYPLNVHMNTHYQKHVCHICGSTFSNSVLLNLHKTRSHRAWRCADCDLTFVSNAEKTRHDVAIHKKEIERKLRFPCRYCEERFSQENNRTQHLVDSHGLPKPEHKCEFCSKVFITRSLRNNHVKNVHQKEKNQECEICHRLFYAKSDVARHRVTHTREKKFSCETCNGLFATKDSLHKHTKRTHSNQ